GLRERLDEPLAVDGPPGKKRVAAHVLLGLTRRRSRFALEPRRIRERLFAEAAAARATGAFGRGPALERAARALGARPGEVESRLLAGLPGERLVATAPALPGPAELALRANLALAQGFLARAASVRIDLDGNARAVVRQARLRGLLCVVRRAATA